jgi:hypothetical protein
LYERGFGVQTVHCGIVTCFKSNEHVGIGRAGQPAKYGVQKTWTQLCRSTGSLREFCKRNLLFHLGLLWQKHEKHGSEIYHVC